MVKYITGDATYPVGDGVKIITHICNDSGGWGQGFVLALSKRWKAPEQRYRREATSRIGLKLGDVQFCPVTNNTAGITEIIIANMVAQKGYKSKTNLVPVQYGALKDCLVKVAEVAKLVHASIHMPRIGCGLGGGEWSKIEPILLTTLEGIETVVYDFQE
jgi:O-acetyl-ADP-ribose deacetylase (regulator of RNase III)